MVSSSRDAASVRIPPPLVPVVTILAGIGLEWLLPTSWGVALPTPARYFVGGAVAIGAILVLGLRSVRLFGESGQSVNPYKPTPALEERGPFRFTRNPMYLQMVLVCIGVAIALANVWVALLTPACAWALQRLAIEPEEAYLEAKFGDAYLDYKSRVRRWI